MEANEIEMESESFAHDIEELIEKENLAGIMDLQDITESDINDLSPESDSLQDTCYESSWQGVLNSADLKQDKTWDKRECNGNMTPCHLLNAEEVDTVLGVHSDNAKLKPAFSTNDSLADYSDISSCSDTETNLDCNVSSSVKVDMGGNQPDQSEDQEEQSNKMHISNADFCSGTGEPNIDKTHQQQNTAGSETSITMGDSKGGDENKEGGEWRNGVLLTNPKDQFSEVKDMGDLDCVVPLSEEGQIEQSDFNVHESGCSVDQPMMNCEYLSTSQEGSTSTLNNTNVDTLSISNGNENNCSIVEIVAGCHPDHNKLDFENTSSKPEFQETFDKSCYEKDSTGGCQLQEKTGFEDVFSRSEFEETFDKSSYEKDSPGGCQLQDKTDPENTSSNPEFEETSEKSSHGNDSPSGYQLQDKTDPENTSSNPEFEETSEKSSHGNDSPSGLQDKTDPENTSSNPEFEETLEKSSHGKDSPSGLQDKTDPENTSSKPEFEETLEKSSHGKDSPSGCQLEEKTDPENTSSKPEFEETLQKSSHVKDLPSGCQLEGTTDPENTSSKPEYEETFEKSSHVKDLPSGCQLEGTTDPENTSSKPEYEETLQKSSHVKDLPSGCQLEGTTDPENTSSKPEFEETFEKSSHVRDLPSGCQLEEKTDPENTSSKPEFEEMFDLSGYEKSPQLDRQKGFTSNDEQVAERSSFGFLESCFGLKSTQPINEECYVTQAPKCSLFNHNEPPILLKAAFESNCVQMDKETSVPKEPPVLSPCQITKTSFKTQKRKLQPVVVLTTTEQKISDGKNYHCFECQESTQTLDELIEHCHYVHSLHKVQYCTTCECYLAGDTLAEHFCGKFKLMDHFNSSPVYSKRPQREAKFICRYCSKAFVRQVYHEEHEERHRAVTQHRCEHCGLYFRNLKKCQSHKHKANCPSLILEPSLETEDLSESTLKRPETTDFALDTVVSNIKLPDCYVKLVDVCKTKQSPNQIQCQFCGKSFKLRAQLKSHLISHSDEKPFKCENCKKDFKYSWNLNKHKREVCLQSNVSLNKSPVTNSKVPAKFKCPICFHLFKYFYNRTRHLREQCLKEYMRKGKGKIGQKYVCPLCKDEFTMSSNRNRHIKNTCLKLKLYTAKGKIIGRKKLEEKITAIKKDKDQPQTQPIQNVARYKCTFCPATYSSKSGFYSHLAKHKFAANTKKASKSKHNAGDLKTSSTESADKNERAPVTCRFCGRVFTSPLLLKKHLQLHKGNRPFRCLECGKNFARRAHLMAHKNVHKRKIQCSVCQEVLQSIGELLKHRQSHPKKGTLKCPECPMQFKFPVFFLRHVVVHENRRKLMTQAQPKVAEKVENIYKEEFKCAVCQKAFADSEALSKHCLTHMPERCASKCQFCKRNFSSRTGLVRHIRLHTGEKPFPCLKCGRHFHRREALKVHQEKCTGAQQLPVLKKSNTKHVPAADTASNTTGKHAYTCLYCPHSFRFPNALKTHERAHIAKTIFPCPQCGKFYRKRKLQDHEDFCKGKEFSACRKCGRTFIRPNYRDVHEKHCQGKVSKETKTNLNRFKQCPQCSKCFRYRSYLLRHLSGHSKKKSHACMHCGQKYNSQQCCLQHEALCASVSKEHKLEHSDETEKTEPVFDEETNKEEVKVVPGANNGEFKCKFCAKSFARARNLRRHILTHTDVKPYRCKTCEGCFSRYDHLKVHQNRCRGKQRLEVRVVKMSLETTSKDSQKQPVQEKDFQCKICSKQFSTSSDLKRHISMLHVTVKPFPCKRCGNTYTSIKSLRRHNLEVKCKKVSKESVQPPKTNVQAQPCRETSKLLQRIQVHYMNKFKYQCNYCPRRFKMSGQLKVHLRLHTGEKPYGCDNCGEHFIRRDYLKRHLVKCSGKTVDGQEKVLCDKCGDLFTQDALLIHQSTCTVNSKSSGSSKGVNSKSSPKVKGFSCANCSDRFLLFSQLQQHFLAKHRANKDNDKQQVDLSPMQILKQEPTDQGYGQSQPSSSQLPTNEQPEISNKDLNKPFKCSHCTMCFTNKAGLGMHMRIHTGVYPLACTKCHVGFWTKKRMEKHRKKCAGHAIVTNYNKASMESAEELDCTLTDTVLVFNKGSNTTGTGVLQTKFSCKDQENGSDKGDAAVHKYQCSECDQSFTDGLRLISHLEEHGREDQERRSGDVHRCHICSRVFAQAGLLQRHVKTQHEYKKSNSCPMCLRNFRCPSDLDIHKSFHDPNRPFVCDVCALRFWTSKAMSIHQTHVHSLKETPNSKESNVKEPELYECQQCDRVYTAKKSYMKHCRMKHKQELGKTLFDNPSSVNQESDKEESSREFEDDDSDNDSDSAPYFPCHVCGKTFLTPESLEDHQRCHLGEKPFECEECGKCFFQLVNLQQHQRSHKSEFQCQMCGKGFVSLFALRKHKQSHVRNTPHRCTKCHLSFTRSAELAEHMITHRDENFPCDLCDETFSCKTSRDKHRKVHTAQEDDLPPLIPPNESQTTQMTTAVPSQSLSSNVEQYRYRCGICQVRYPDPEQLSEHGCNPAKERPYSCPECNKYFLHGSHLKKHQLSHQLSGRHSYQCNRCSMSFSHHHHYLAHLRSHRDEEPRMDTNIPSSEKICAENPKRDKIYQCPICPESFYQALDLANHLSVHSHMCSVCNMTFSTKEDLEEHEKCHLTAATQYECTECGNSFLGSDAFRKHHCSSRKIPFSEKRTSESSFSSPHKKQRSERPFEIGDEEEEDVDVGEDFFKCCICQKRFSSSSSLLEHHKVEHDKRPFKCLVCGKGFTRKRYLTQHQQTHSERPFQCNVCAESFRTETALLSHGKMHDTKRKHHCLICNKSYLTAKDLYKHKQKHVEHKSVSRDNDFRCDMCYKSFSMFSQLTKHQETHVGQVVYECTECDKAFAFPSLLEEHQRSHAVSTESLQPQPLTHFTYQNPVN